MIPSSSATDILTNDSTAYQWYVHLPTTATSTQTDLLPQRIRPRCKLLTILLRTLRSLLTASQCVFASCECLPYVQASRACTDLLSRKTITMTALNCLRTVKESLETNLLERDLHFHCERPFEDWREEDRSWRLKDVVGAEQTRSDRSAVEDASKLTDTSRNPISYLLLLYQLTPS